MCASVGGRGRERGEEGKRGREGLGRCLGEHFFLFSLCLSLFVSLLSLLKSSSMRMRGAPHTYAQHPYTPL